MNDSGMDHGVIFLFVLASFTVVDDVYFYLSNMSFRRGIILSDFCRRRMEAIFDTPE